MKPAMSVALALMEPAGTVPRISNGLPTKRPLVKA